MEITLYIIGFLLLLGMNAFYVLAEFAAVRIRSSQIEEMVDLGVKGARNAQHIHANMDEFLSVCQVGITFASIALGFVGESMAVKLILPQLHGNEVISHVIATVASVIMVSFIHILIGEQVPKLFAIRRADTMAIFTALPLRWSRMLFYAPLWLLNACSHAILRAIGVGDMPTHEKVSEDELRIILEQSQTSGIMSFRRLLFMENIFDLADLKAKDAMKHVSLISSLSDDMLWSDVIERVRKDRHSRYPFIERGKTLPSGFVHIKSIFAEERQPDQKAELTELLKSLRAVADTTPLEQVLSDMQRSRLHMMMVTRDGAFAGIITLEDILEEIVGTITDEFENDPPVYLSEVLTPQRIILHIEGLSIVDAVRTAFMRIPEQDLPAPGAAIVRGIADRERVASTYLGHGVAIPHARLEVNAASLFILRSEKGIPLARSGTERIHLMFVMITPAGQPRIHQKIQARIAQLMSNSEIIEDRIMAAATNTELFEVIKTGEQASID
ncbi:MAG: CNNM domain-containing protein [Spirochaetota bacterium]